MLLIIRCLLIFGLLASASGHASTDQDFLAAREAYQKGKSAQFQQMAERFPREHPLRVYLDYWQLKNRGAATDELLQFADANPGTPLSELVLQQVARFHGKNRDWPVYRQVAARLARHDPEILCFDLSARLDQNDPDATGDALTLWRTAQDLPSSCVPVFDSLRQRGVLTPELHQERLRLSLEAGNLRLARELIADQGDSTSVNLERLERAGKTPEKVLEGTSLSAVHREIQLYALARIAGIDASRAAELWQDRNADFPEASHHYGWGVIAMAGARQQHPDAAIWFLNAHTANLSETQRVARARAMLRAGRWLDVFQSIVSLPQSTQNEAVWRYWKARSLKTLNADFQANQLFAQLSREPHYYGLLAYEELPVRLENRPEEYRLTPERIQASESRPGLARALLLRKLGLPSDAVAEWEWALRGLDDHDILAAAELARRAEWYDRAIITAEKTREVHSFNLRYLTPYRDLAESQAHQNGLDPAWVYGLMRQESRFVDYARSRVGAQGLMQIMPATAKWIAGQMKLGKHAQAQMADPAANIRFGTYYLRHLNDSLNSLPVLATAGYNAGPGRARRWQADTPLEGAIYVETIPFTETREYVKKVLANAMHYSRQLGTPALALKDRLGVIPARQRPELAANPTIPTP